MSQTAISPALQLIAAGASTAIKPEPDPSIAARRETETRVHAEVSRELALMVGEKLRDAQHQLIDVQHGQVKRGGQTAEELSIRVAYLRNFHELFTHRASA